MPGGLRAAGWSLTTLTEHYGIPADESVSDVDWLELAGQRGWAVLMKDDRIRRRPTEVAALKAAGVHAFCIANGNLTAEQQLQVLLKHQNGVFLRCGGQGPSLHTLNMAGMRIITL